MPIYIKPIDIICKERAESDAVFYYEYFKNLLIENMSETNDAESRINFARLNKWIEEYKKFAYNFHLKNFVRGSDMFSDPEIAQYFSYNIKIPRAPFIEVFGDLDASH